MSLLKIAIVGRPNVGKSALFNRIIGKKVAIVDEMEGVTRDRLIYETEVFGIPFAVIDTAGFGHEWKEVREQTLIAIEQADRVIFVVDATVGVHPTDQEVAKLLHQTKKSVVIAANKIDNGSKESLAGEFYSLGFKTVIPVSAAHGYQVAELLTEALQDIKKEVEEPDTTGKIKVAFIGRPNVGKSTLLNQILGEPRSVVSPTAGTTRDSVDVEYGDFILIDTAGIRRKHGEHEVVDKFAAIRTERAIERCDVCVLITDAQEGLTTQEKKIAADIEASGKGCVVWLNKWDLVKGFQMEHCIQGIRQEASFLNYCPVILGSALTGRNIDKLFEQIKITYASLKQRVTTGELNRLIERFMQLNHPPMLQGKRLRIFYTTQVKDSPPTFVSFVNHPDRMTETYQKYLLNQLREVHPFTGAPIHYFVKPRSATARP
ncbi:MAG: ribosome biogenesis GTPase Der [Simkaniaceae bacterium]|nr:ribosome biogenesis GTPase Der [Simkaniaceae bacterium]